MAKTADNSGSVRAVSSPLSILRSTYDSGDKAELHDI